MIGKKENCLYFINVLVNLGYLCNKYFKKQHIIHKWVVC